MKLVGIIIIGVLVLVGTKVMSQRIQTQKLLKMKNFEERLTDQLVLAKNNFDDPNMNFGINFSNGRMVIFQIIKRTLLEGVSDEDFGFGIHLSFDDSFPETALEKENFRNSEFAKEFKYHNWDGIDTYQLDLKHDTDKIIELTKKIIEIVYLKEVSKTAVEIFPI